MVSETLGVGGDCIPNNLIMVGAHPDVRFAGSQFDAQLVARFEEMLRSANAQA